MAALVAIDSVNPDLVPGGAGEAEIADFVAGWLREAGLEVELDEPAPGRPNVVAVARGSGGGASLMLNAHMDTVGVEGMERPFEPVVRDGRLYGRGAYDMKASLAACMLAARRLAAEELSGDVIVTAVADEEYASIGVQSVLAAPARRRRDRDRADRAARVRGPQGIRLGRARDRGARRPRLAPRRGRGCDHPHGARAGSPRRAPVGARHGRRGTSSSGRGRCTPR